MKWVRFIFKSTVHKLLESKEDKEARKDHWLDRKRFRRDIEENYKIITAVIDEYQLKMIDEYQNICIKLIEINLEIKKNLYFIDIFYL